MVGFQIYKRKSITQGHNKLIETLLVEQYPAIWGLFQTPQKKTNEETWLAMSLGDVPYWFPDLQNDASIASSAGVNILSFSKQISLHILFFFLS